MDKVPSDKVRWGDDKKLKEGKGLGGDYCGYKVVDCENRAKDCPLAPHLTKG